MPGGWRGAAAGDYSRRVIVRAVVLLAALAAAPASADIYRWTDANGVDHYTTHPETIPEDARGDAAPFVRERPRAPAPPVEATRPTEPAPVDEVADGREARESPHSPAEDRVAGAFAAGFEAGSRVAPPQVVEIGAPSVVQNVIVEADDPVPQWIGAPVFAAHPRVFRRPAPPLERRRRHDPAPFVVGPAGPPPLGAPGPAPVTFD